MISQVLSSSRTARCSQSSQSAGKLTRGSSPSGFSLSSLSSAVRSDVVFLHLCFNEPMCSGTSSARTVPVPPVGGGLSHPPLELTLGIGPACVRWEPVGGARPALVPLCGRRFAGASCGSFLNDLQIFLGSHLMFLGLVLFLFIMFHSGISQLCVKSKRCCKRLEVGTFDRGTIPLCSPWFWLKWCMAQSPESACWRAGGPSSLPGRKQPRVPGPGQQTGQQTRQLGVFSFTGRCRLWSFSMRQDGAKWVEVEEGDYSFSFLIKARRFLFERPFDGSGWSTPLVNSTTDCSCRSRPYPGSFCRCFPGSLCASVDGVCRTSAAPSLRRAMQEWRNLEALCAIGNGVSEKKK